MNQISYNWLPYWRFLTYSNSKPATRASKFMLDRHEWIPELGKKIAQLSCSMSFSEHRLLSLQWAILNPEISLPGMSLLFLNVPAWITIVTCDLHQWLYAYMFCHSQTCVVPLQKGRQEPQSQCKRCQTAGSSAQCCRCFLIPGPGSKYSKTYIRLCSGCYRYGLKLWS